MNTTDQDSAADPLAAADELVRRFWSRRSEPAMNPELEALALMVPAELPVWSCGEPGIGGIGSLSR